MSHCYELDLWLGATVNPDRTVKIETSSSLNASGFVEMLQDTMASYDIPSVACAIFYQVAPDGHLHCCDVERDVSRLPVSSKERS